MIVMIIIVLGIIQNRTEEGKLSRMVENTTKEIYHKHMIRKKNEIEFYYIE